MIFTLGGMKTCGLSMRKYDEESVLQVEIVHSKGIYAMYVVQYLQSIRSALHMYNIYNEALLIHQL